MFWACNERKQEGFYWQKNNGKERIKLSLKRSFFMFRVNFLYFSFMLFCYCVWPRRTKITEATTNHVMGEEKEYKKLRKNHDQLYSIVESLAWETRQSFMYRILIRQISSKLFNLKYNRQWSNNNKMTYEMMVVSKDRSSGLNFRVMKNGSHQNRHQLPPEPRRTTFQASISSFNQNQLQP